MLGLAELWSFASLLRDSTYDTVFALGDTSLQFGAELIHGPQNTRYGQYAYRQIERQQKPLQAKPPQKPNKQQTKPKAVRPHKTKFEQPLKFEEKRSFAEMMRRQNGESIIEHWKRQKVLLAAPEKQQLIQQHNTLKEQMRAKEMSENAIQAEMKSISSQYQKTRAPKQQTKTRKRSRTR